MSGILVSNIEKTDTHIFADMSSDKKAASFAYSHAIGQINVCVKNASHQAWGGMGKFFNYWDDALNNYKSSDVKAMILHFKEIAAA